MKKKDLVKLTDYYFKSFETLYLQMVDTDNKESVHDTRVSVKRIMALLAFFEELKICNKKQVKKILSDFKIFDIAGKYRENQIYIELLELYKSKLNHKFDNLHRSLKRTLIIFKYEFQNSMGDISFIEIYKNTEIIKGTINNTSEKKIAKGFKKYVEGRVLFCNKYSAESNFREYLHEIRRKLKQLRFILEQIKLYQKKEIKDILSFKDLKQVELMLGDWHDLDLFLQIVMAYLARKRGNYDLTLYNNLINNIKSGLVKMEQEIKFALVPVLHSFMLLIR